MNKTLQQIRDLDLIEKELNSCHTGIFAFISNERVCQTAATYIYRNKNVYVFLNESEEVHLNIKPGTPASFTVSDFRRKKINPRNENSVLYSLMSVSVSGIANHLTDQKLIEDVVSDYLLKYSRSGSSLEEMLSGIKIIFIDSEEIQAYKETGS